ncbi:hypothetical protein ANRL3_00281 [Anaerolineae bacterium]|nr:hypothetical protein ANRL3_00281 [Anaerolineae bacterium]
MKRAIPFDPLGDIGKIQDIMDSTPPDPLKALEAEYEIALGMLVARLPMGTSIATPNEEKMVKRLARHFLFNYNTGFSILKFAPAYDHARTPTARQLALEESIKQLACLESARDVMDEWFRAALERRLHQTLREFLNADKLTLNPRRAVTRTAARIGLSNDLEVLGRMRGSIYKTIDFGMSGYYLLVKSTGTIRSQEFETLLEYVRNTYAKFRDDDVPGLIDVARVLAVPRLASEQIDELIQLILSLQDLEQFPASDLNDVATDPMTRVDQVAQNMGFSAPIRFAIKLMAKVFEKQLREEARRSREIQKELHPYPEQEELEIRRSVVVKVARILSNQSDRFLSALEQTNQQTRLPDEPFVDIQSGAWFSQEVLTDTLVSALQNLPSLRILANHLSVNGSGSLAEETLKALHESDQVIGKPIVEFLIEVIREHGDSACWAGELFENLPGLTEPAEQFLSRILQTEDNRSVLKALMRVHENLTFRQHLPTADLQAALLKRLTDLLLDEKAALDPEWLAWFARMGREYLTRMLTRLSSAWSNNSSLTIPARHQGILRELSRQAERLSTLDTISLAACLLVDPDDWMKSGVVLPDRVRLALRYLAADDTDRSIAEEVAQLIKIAVLRRSDTRQSLATVLRTMHFPDLGLPLLELLMEIALDERAERWSWWASQETRRKLFGEAIKSIAAVSPLTPRAIILLERTLFAYQDSRTGIIRELTPAFIYDELLPLLTHEVDSDAVPVLMERIWKNHCAPLVDGESPCVRRNEEFFLQKFEHPTWRLTVDEKIHRYLHIYQKEGYYPEGEMLLCALQALANVDNLSLPEQSLIWRVYRTSWHALTKSLCLLILGRQRPIRTEIVLELINLLHRSPTTELWKVLIKHGFRSFLFGLIIHSSPPDSDFNYLYLCQSVAVDLISNLLKEGPENHVIAKYRAKLEQALLQTTDLFRYGMEPHMGGFTSMGNSTSGTKGIAKLIGASQQEEEHLSWIAQPADRAYQNLHELIASGFIHIQSRRDRSFRFGGIPTKN